MTKKKDQKDQSQRFIEKARELGGDESAEAFERAVKKILPKKHVNSTDDERPA